ncbi:MAG: KamA family radical SAM protein [Lachnospiraceae bacterium]|nr:KamA family radical SAM protein [Lachnospiraceae bacterium]
MTYKINPDSTITSVDELSRHISLETEEVRAVANRYPMSIPDYYLSLIDPEDPGDPIRRMSVPSVGEMARGGTFDTSGENSNTVMQGMQHKYPQTVLILSTNQCAMYCRYCFRKRMVGTKNTEIAEDLEAIFSYIKKHQEITNVLISGGDSLMMDNAKLERYLAALTSIDHLNYIRFGTKIPVVLPQRITEDPELLQMFERYGEKKQLYVITQFNHPRELTPASVKAVKMLRQRGVVVKNQSVLLNGVNSDPDTLAELFKKLSAAGIVPYYLFQCRPVSGVKNQFQVPLLRAYDIVEGAKRQLDGNAKCFRYAMSNVNGKVEILGKEENTMIFKYQQAKDEADRGRLFSRTLTEEDCWVV